MDCLFNMYANDETNKFCFIDTVSLSTSISFFRLSSQLFFSPHCFLLLVEVRTTKPIQIQEVLIFYWQINQFCHVTNFGFQLLVSEIF